MSLIAILSGDYTKLFAGNPVQVVCNPISVNHLIEGENLKSVEITDKSAASIRGGKITTQWYDREQVLGKVKGLCARGGFVVDMKWENAKITDVSVLSKIGGELHLSAGTSRFDAMTKTGEIINLGVNLIKK